MNLKKQMEKDLKELQEKLLVLDTGYDMENPNYFECWKLSGQIEILEKYLKHFEKEQKLLVIGKKYRTKAGRHILKDSDCPYCEPLIEELAEATIQNIEWYDRETNFGRVDFIYGCGNEKWQMDIETFKHMFEEVKDENYNR